MPPGTPEHAQQRTRMHNRIAKLRWARGGPVGLSTFPPIVKKKYKILLLLGDRYSIIGIKPILFRGAGIDVVWPHFVFVALAGGLFFGAAVLRFRTVTNQ